MVPKCSNCFWAQSSGPHNGCYFDGKWRKWIPKKEYDIPRDCQQHKKRPEGIRE